jgi:hypothetical protein
VQNKSGDAEQGGLGSIKLTEELAKEQKCFSAMPVFKPGKFEAHYENTA